jgi:hypothetical protein
MNDVLGDKMREHYMTSRRHELGLLIDAFYDRKLKGEMLTDKEEYELKMAVEELQELANKEVRNRQEVKEVKGKARKKVNRRWKRAEDWWAKQTGWNRKGHMLQGVSCADLSNEVYSLDVTTFKTRIPNLWSELRDAQFHATPTQLPIIALHKEGDDMKNGIICMTAEDFIHWYVGSK